MKRLILSLISIFSIVFASQAVTYTVTSNADGGTGSLRQAIADASNNVGGGGPHTIIFNAGMTITLNNSLSLNNANLNGLTINGFVDATAGPDVIIRSNNLCSVRGFDINFALTSLKFYGLVFQNLEYGIYFNASISATANNSQIKGCYFGTDITGSTIANGICRSGIVFMGVSSSTIGGPNTNLPNGAATASNNAERCLFGGTCNSGDNGRYGAIQLQKGSNNVSILNNYIGANLAGTTVLPIGNPANKKAVTQNGISIDDEPSFNTIISNNVISGAIGSGINIFTREDRAASNGHIITGNIIGLNPAGTLGYNVTAPASSFGNQASGIYIRNASNVTIGGSTPATRNVISANGGATHTWPDASCFTSWNDYNQIAVYLEWCVNSKITGNYIGTNAAGTSSGIGTNNIFGNRSGGIKIVGGSTGANNNFIGGSGAGEGNVISGNGYLWGTFTTGLCGSLSGISTGHGIVLQYADCNNTSILGNYIGLTADGVTGLGNNTSGIDLQGASNTTIGGGVVGARNYICNNQFGITLQEDFDVHNVATNTVVAGNYIGLNVNAAAVGNGVSASFTEGAGIVIQKGANTNTIGVSVAGGGNVISGNRTGIIIRNSEGAGSGTGPARNNTIQNNIIGLDPTGASAIPNTSATAGYGYGIQIEVGIGSATTTFPFANIIGGTGANQANTISSNQKSGVYIGNGTNVTASTANSITGNNIGTNKAGTADLGNTLQGIEIVNVNKTTITSNLISGNGQNGISLTGSSTNTIQNNTIGSNITKTAPIPNGSNGIAVLAGSANNVIGGVAANQPNFIFNNAGNGVVVNGTGSTKNSIHQNSFSCNTGRGIVLSAGGNDGYTAPAITGTPTQITWAGPVDSYIEVFETDGCATCPTDPTRLQGKKLVGSGPSPYVFNAAEGFDKTKTYTAIAHEANASTAHNTSEFSICYTLCQGPTSVTVTGAPLTFCESGSVTLTANVVGGTGTPAYVWKRGGVVISGATSSTYTASIGGSYTVEYTSTTTCGPTPSAAVTVTVNPRPTVTSDPTGTVCSGVAQNYTITSSIPSTFSWTRAAVAGITPATGSGSTNKITEILTNTGTTALTVKYLITPTSTPGSCAATAPFTYTVTVNPGADVADQTPAAICSNGAFSVTPAGVPAGTTYTWAAPVVTGSVSGASAQSTAQASISQTLKNNGITAATVVYTVTPKTGTCFGETFKVTVTVNPAADVADQTPAAICSNGAFSVTPAGVPAGTTYTWAAPVVTGSVSGASAQSTAQASISQTLKNNGITAATVVYTVTPKTGTCFGETFKVTVTVNPAADVADQAPAAICSNSAFSVTPAGAPAGTTYTWAAPVITGSVSGASAQSTAQASIGQTLKNNGITAATVVYTVTPKTGTCSGETFKVTVTVNPAADVADQAPAAICSNSAFSVTPAGAPAGTTYTWAAPVITGSVSGASAQSTAQASISQTLKNNGTTAATVVYTVTPKTGTCSGETFKVTVTVKPAADVADQAPAAICSNGAFSVTPAGAPAGTTYTWAAPVITGSVSGASAQSTAQASISQTLKNNGTAAATVVYTVTPKTGTCLGKTFKVTVTVNPAADIADQAPAAICSETAFSVTPAGAPAGTTYTWAAPVITGSVSGASAQLTAQASISQTLKNNGTTAATVVYTVTPKTGICSGETFKVTVTVNPKPVAVITAISPTDICSTGSVDLTATATGFIGGTFEWFNGSASLGSANNNSLTVNAAGTYHVVYTAATTCESNPSASVTVTIKDPTSPAVVSADSIITCLDHVELEAEIPAVGIGSWSVVLPSTATITPGATPNLATGEGLLDKETYQFVFTVTGDCGVNTDTIFVEVGIDDFDVTASGPSDTLCVKTNRELVATVTGGSGNFSYLWGGSDGTSVTTTSPTIIVNPSQASTTYVVVVSDLDKIGCKAILLTAIEIHSVESQNLFIPNLITPNGDDKNDIFYLADRSFTPPMPMISEGSHLEIVNRWGSKVFEANNYKNDWDAKELTDGIYYYHITSSCGNKEYKSWIQILGNTNN